MEDYNRLKHVVGDQLEKEIDAKSIGRAHELAETLVSLEHAESMNISNELNRHELENKANKGANKVAPVPDVDTEKKIPVKDNPQG